MLFTDCQLWNSSGTRDTIQQVWREYKGVAPHARLYLFDLAGHGKLPLDVLKDDVFLVNLLPCKFFNKQWENSN